MSEKFKMCKVCSFKFTWNQILILYILIGAIVCNILPIPELAKGAIATPTFLIIPYLFGHIILTIFKKYINISLSKTSYIFISFAVGFIFIPVLAFLLHSFQLFNATTYSFLLLSILLIYFLKSKKYDLIAEIKCKKINLNIVLFLFTFLFAVLFILYYQPFPYSVDHDSFWGHIPISHLIKDYNYYVFQSDYNPTITLVIPILSILFQLDIYTLFWYGQHFIFPFLVLFGFYILSLKLFLDERIYFLAFLSLLFAGAHTIGSPIGFYLFKPSNFIIILFLFVIYLIEKEFIPIYSKTKFKDLLIIVITFLIISFLLYPYLSSWIFKFMQPVIGYQNLGIGIFLLFFVLFILPIFFKRRFNFVNENFKILFLLTVIMLLLFMVHIPMAMLIFPFILIYLLLRYIGERNFLFVRNLSICIVIIFLIVFSLQYYGIYNFETNFKENHFLDPDTGNMWRTPDFLVKQETLIHEYWTYPVFMILLFGIVFGIFDKKYRKIFPPLIIIAIGLISFYLFIRTLGQERGLNFANPLISLIIAYAIIKISSFVNLSRSKIFKATIVGVCIIIFISLIIYPMYTYIEVSVKGGYTISSVITIEEYNAGKWMKNHLTKNTFIVSDPLTNHAVGSVAGLRFVDMYDSKWRKALWWSILHSNNSNEIYTKTKETITWQNMTYFGISNISQYPINQSVIVINERTVKWIKSETYRDGTYIPVSASTNYSITKEDIQPFLNPKYFTLLYNDSNKLYVFGVNPEPGTKYKIQNEK